MSLPDIAGLCIGARARAARIRSRLIVAVAGLTVGIVLREVFAAELSSTSPPEDAQPMLWAADRGGDRLVALGPDLHVLRVLQVGAPYEVEPAEDGCLWVLRSWSRGARGPAEIVLLDEAGRPLVRVTLDQAKELVALPGRRAAVLGCQTGTASGARLYLAAADGRLQEMGDREDLVALTACGEDLLAGASGGELELWRSSEMGAPVAEHRLPLPLEDLVRGPRWGTWWALCREPDGARLILLDARLEPIWERVLGEMAGPLVSVPELERVWLVARDDACCLAVGGGGTLECFRSDLPALPSGPGAPAPDGGVYFVLPGAILALDERGACRPGQAGFEDLTDLARAAN